MNDLRSPMEDRPYSPSARPSPRMAQEEYAENEYGQSSLFNRIRHSRWFPLGSVFAAVIVFSVIVSYAYKQGSHTGADATVPTIEAENTSYKDKPADPGGMDVPFQDAVVFDQLQDHGKTAEKETIESLLPPPEQALAETTVTKAAPPAVTETPATNETIAAEPVESETAHSETKTETTTEAPPAVAADNAGNVATAITSNEVHTDTDAIITEKPEPVVAKETADNALAKTLDKTAPSSASAASRIESGNYRIQLGAFRDEAAAHAAWGKFQKQFNSRLGSVTPQFARADLGEKGVFYRVQGTNLSKSSADDLCRTINAAKSGSCIVTR